MPLKSLDNTVSGKDVFRNFFSVKRIRQGICFLASLFALASVYADSGGLIPQTFHSKQFSGLVSPEVTSWNDAVLDYQLDSAKGGAIRFTRCEQVEAIQEENIADAEYQLFKLLAMSCVALKRYVNASPAKQSFFPPHLTQRLVGNFPATAVPLLNEEDEKRRAGKTLSSYGGSKLKINVPGQDVVVAASADDKITYSMMARADFNGDGIEDMLVRADRSSPKAFGTSSEVLLLSKASPSSPVVLAWRIH